MKTLLLEANEVFRVQRHRHTWTWKLLAASVSLMMCKGSISWNTCCTADSTWKSSQSSKHGSLGTGKCGWFWHTDKILPSSCFGHWEYRDREKGKWSIWWRGPSPFCLVPQSILLLSLSLFFYLHSQPQCLPAAFLSWTCVSLTPKEAEIVPSMGLASGLNEGIARHQHELLSSLNLWRKLTPSRAPWHLGSKDLGSNLVWWIETMSANSMTCYLSRGVYVFTWNLVSLVIVSVNRMWQKWSCLIWKAELE